jgi:putative endonuclease
MASHNETGIEGEKLAEAWLIMQGYSILHRNWRSSRYEIDIIASKDEMLHFIEVKCLYHSPFIQPEDKVTKGKFKRIQHAADHYLSLNAGNEWIQYDVLSITLYKDRDPEYFLLEDVFL